MLIFAIDNTLMLPVLDLQARHTSQKIACDRNNL